MDKRKSQCLVCGRDTGRTCSPDNAPVWISVNEEESYIITAIITNDGIGRALQAGEQGSGSCFNT
jgi:hypothetical protein